MNDLPIETIIKGVDQLAHYRNSRWRFCIYPNKCNFVITQMVRSPFTRLFELVCPAIVALVVLVCWRKNAQIKSMKSSRYLKTYNNPWVGSVKRFLILMSLPNVIEKGREMLKSWNKVWTIPYSWNQVAIIYVKIYWECLFCEQKLRIWERLNLLNKHITSFEQKWQM
jgi:hypothetical protein